MLREDIFLRAIMPTYAESQNELLRPCRVEIVIKDCLGLVKWVLGSRRWTHVVVDTNLSLPERCFIGRVDVTKSSESRNVLYHCSRTAWARCEASSCGGGKSLVKMLGP